jgi:hypothetical protein
MAAPTSGAPTGLSSSKRYIAARISADLGRIRSAYSTNALRPLSTTIERSRPRRLECLPTPTCGHSDRCYPAAMVNRLVPPQVWILIAGLSGACAFIRYLGLSAVAYTFCYALLTVLGMVAGLWLALQRNEHRDGRRALFLSAFAPLCLLFIDMTSGARVFCLIAISVAALSALKQRSPLAQNGNRPEQDVPARRGATLSRCEPDPTDFSVLDLVDRNAFA